MAVVTDTETRTFTDLEAAEDAARVAAYQYRKDVIVAMWPGRLEFTLFVGPEDPTLSTLTWFPLLTVKWEPQVEEHK